MMEVFISLELAHNYADGADAGRGLTVLHCDAVLDFLEWKARQFLQNGSFSLELLSLPCEA